MPIYEYQCAACGHTFDTLQKLSEAPLTRCPACGAEALKKLISPAGFRLKGGGWYETDFKTGSKKNVAAGDKPGTDSKDKPASASTGSGEASKPKK
jgi:putative FmdB family regulatory protein